MPNSSRLWLGVFLFVMGLFCLALKFEVTITEWRIVQRLIFWFGVAAFLLGLVGYTAYQLRPEIFPQHAWYDFIEHRDVTLRLVDQSLIKVESWEIEGLTQNALFIHPAETGSTTLVYPVMIRPNTTFAADIALAPGSWQLPGDGVTFSLFIEDRTGIRLLYSLYVDPKHHQQDRRWIPVRVNLEPYSGELVRVILSVNSGPAGDARNDWSGWGNPRLEQPSLP